VFIAPPLIVSDSELEQIFDALHVGLQVADTAMA
jgi:adenosylmethionine-8-amino-7-oxononanoate aminotransferase